MLTVLRIISGLIGFALAIYGLLTGKRELMPYMFLCIGVMLAMIGISEFQSKRKWTGAINILISILMLFLFIKGIFLNQKGV